MPHVEEAGRVPRRSHGSPPASPRQPRLDHDSRRDRLSMQHTLNMQTCSPASSSSNSSLCTFMSVRSVTRAVPAASLNNWHAISCGTGVPWTAPRPRRRPYLLDGCLEIPLERRRALPVPLLTRGTFKSISAISAVSAAANPTPRPPPHLAAMPASTSAHPGMCVHARMHVHRILSPARTLLVGKAVAYPQCRSAADASSQPRTSAQSRTASRSDP